MTDEFNNLVQSFDQALQKKEKGKFKKDDVKKIYQAASKLFDGEVRLSSDQIEKIRDKWVELADGRIDKGNAMKKLQGTSRAEAMQSVLLSSL